MQRVRKYYAVILTTLMVTVLAPVGIMAADMESAESDALEWEKKSGGVVRSQKPNEEKWLKVYSSTDPEDPETAPSYLEQPSPKLDTYYYYVNATGKPLIKYKTEDGWFDATEYIRDCIQWELNNYYVDYTGTPAEGINPKAYMGTRISKNQFTETYGYEPGKDEIINFYDVQADAEYCCPWVPIMEEGTSLSVDDFYYTVTGLTYIEDDPETLNVWEKLGANVIKIQDGYFIGANAPAWESAELTGDTTIHRGTNWLTYTGTTKWGDTYTVTFPIVGQPKPMVAVEEENTEIEEDEIDLVPVPDTRKVPIAILGVPLGGALVAFFWMTHRKIKFHGIFDVKNDNIIIKGKAEEEHKNDWFIPSINERLVNRDFNSVDKYIEVLENCGVLSLFPIDTEMFIHAELYSSEIYSVKTKANEKLLFKTLTELEDRVVGPVEVILANANKHINIKINYFI